MAQTIEELQAEGRTLEILSLFPRQGEWTEEDYFRLPETNRIVELSQGRLIITPSPTDKHQSVSLNLVFLIGSYIRTNNLGIIRYSPLDVWLYEGTVRQPDIVFMKNEHKDRITDKRWNIPDLVIEILSEGTAKADKEDKYLEYQKAGVSEYWIVDPFEQTIEVFTFATECLAKKLENGAYTLLGKWGSGEIAHSKVIDGLQVAVNSVFE